MQIGIIGLGNIGGEICAQSERLGWKVGMILKEDGVYATPQRKIDDFKNYPSHCSDLDAVFLTIPTFDDGATAFNYLKFFLEKNIPVITSEKGALSNYFAELRPWKSKIGYSATVGGGTRLLKYAEAHVGSTVLEIHAVLNGTLNFIFELLAHGVSINDAVSKAKVLKYAEPGSNSPLELINKEAISDVPMKSAILFNLVNPANFSVKAKDFTRKAIGEKELKKLIDESKKMRYVVSIMKKDDIPDMIGGFIYHCSQNWTIAGGFLSIETLASIRPLFPRGAENAIFITSQGGDLHSLIGPGAGPGPTVSAMIKDAMDLIKK